MLECLCLTPRKFKYCTSLAECPSSPMLTTFQRVDCTRHADSQWWGLQAWFVFEGRGRVPTFRSTLDDIPREIWHFILDQSPLKPDFPKWQSTCTCSWPRHRHPIQHERALSIRSQLRAIHDSSCQVDRCEVLRGDSPMAPRDV